MSFITKRERVFNDYDLFELPPRNECKLKAFGSCTDARAWSHFSSDKTEHLVDIIKRNNGTCRPNYLPTEVIVNTLMGAKNAEIARLKRKIAELEQMIAAFDQLELSCEQKVEIAAAHNAIKAANKELDDMCLDLDLSGFTEGIDSEAFETGKSRGDDPSPFHPQFRDDEAMAMEKSTGSSWSFSNERDFLPPVQKQSKGNQTETICPCDKSTIALDPRINELQEMIITKDAKLCAMRNTIAVMENDVCEPYCIYAHIYTALEKIFGVLSQNDKYCQYLNLLTAGKDLRCIDIKGKILFKMKVLEKFCVALIAPCSQRMIQSDFNSTSQIASRMNPDCCYHAEVISEIETSFALTSEESFRPMLDSKRAQLVADIIEHDEMKKILDDEDDISDKDSITRAEFESLNEDYSIDAENIKRLKDLQKSYDELITNYENILHEKDCLQIRCQKYDELEKELENLRNQLREYNVLWNERDYYKRRSEDLDSLKEQYLVLTEETTGMETRLRAEAEINNIKSNTIDSLRSENIELEKKLNDAVIAFEKEKNRLQCELKEFECKTMCKDQQIKSLSSQVDRLLDQEFQSPTKNDQASIILIDEIESLKEQIENLKSALVCTDEEKQQLQKDFEDSLQVITNLRIEIENWKGSYEQSTRKSKSQESLARNYEEEIFKKNAEIENLLLIIKDKSKSFDDLRDEMIQKYAEKENEILLLQNKNKLLEASSHDFHSSITTQIREKEESLKTLEIERKESMQLLTKVLKDVQDKDIQLQSMKQQSEELRNDQADLLEKNRSLQKNIEVCEKSLQSAEAAKDFLSKRILHLEQKLESMQIEKNNLENDLAHKNIEIKSLQDSKHVFEKKSQELLNEANELVKKKSEEQCDLASQSLKLQNDLDNINDTLKKTKFEKEGLKEELNKKCNEIEKLLKLVDDLRKENQEVVEKNQLVDTLRRDTKRQLETLQNSNEQMLQDLKKKDAEFDIHFQEFRQFQKEYDSLKRLNDNLLRENDKLLIANDKMKAENEFLNEKNNFTLSEKNDLKEKVEDLQNQIIKQSIAPKIPYEDILKQVQAMEKEKDANQKKIRELQDKLEQLENEIEISQDKLSDRNVKISVLENHINNLDDEVKRLHNNLQLAVKTGEDIKVNSNEKLDHSLKKLEAHHSKATHNMKLELAKLKTLEQTLLKVRTSSQLLLDKTNEAQMIAEREKEKINHEKEGAIQDKHMLEKELIELKNQLEKQNKKTKDLEAEIQNDKLILENVKQSNQIYIEDLKNNLNKLQTLYDDSLSKVENLQKNVDDISKERDNLSKMLQKANADIKQKAQDIKTLVKDLESVQNKSTKNAGVQVQPIDKKSQPNVIEGQNKGTPVMSVYHEVAAVENLKEKFSENIPKDTHKDTSSIQLDVDNSVDVGTQTKPIESVYSFKRNYVISKMEHLSFREIEHHSVSFDKIELMGTTKDQVYSGRKDKEQNKEKDLQQTGLKNDHDIGLYVEPPSFTIELEETNQVQSNGGKNKKDKKKKNEHQKSVQKNNETDLHNEPISLISELNNTNKDVLENSEELKKLAQKPSTPELKDYNKEQLDILDNNSMRNKEQKAPNSNMENDHNIYLSKKPDIFTSELKDINRDILNSSGKKTKRKQDQDTSEVGFKNDKVIDLYNKSTSLTSTKYDLFFDSSNNDNRDSPKTPDMREVNETPHISQNKLSDEDMIYIYNDSESTSKETTSKSPIQTNTKKSDKKHNQPKHQEMQQMSEKITKSYFMGSGPNEQEKDGYEKYHDVETVRYEMDSPSIGVTSDDGKDSINFYTVNPSPKRIYSDLKILNGTTSIDRKSPSLPSLLRKKFDSNTFFGGSSDENINMSYKRKGKGKIPTNRDVTSPVAQDKSLLNLIKNETKDFGLEYILDSVSREIDRDKMKLNAVRTSSSPVNFDINKDSDLSDVSPVNILSLEYETKLNVTKFNNDKEHSPNILYFEKKIRNLMQALQDVKEKCKNKIEVIKIQYDNNIKQFLSEHNQGVENMQNLHEQTLQDTIKAHENEVENLRAMALEAMRKAEKLDRENKLLRSKLLQYGPICDLDEESIKSSCECKRRKHKSRGETRLLTKTNVEAFNVKPKPRSNGPCTCSVDVNISDTIKNIFEQVDVEQRKIAEQTYLKYIAQKIIKSNIEELEAEELSFLHLKVCKNWKTKVAKEEAMQKIIDSRETELMNKQRNAQQLMADLDRRVADERRKLQEVREAVRLIPDQAGMPPHHPDISTNKASRIAAVERDTECFCNKSQNLLVSGSGGDLVASVSQLCIKPRTKHGNKALLMKQESEGRREKKLYSDEPPTRLRRSHDRQTLRSHKK